jgi:hypothetical protein
MSAKPQEKSIAARAATLRHEHEAEGSAAAAVAGAAMGSIAGLPGAVAGAVIGGVVGAVAAAVLDGQSEDLAALDRKLDEEIGVDGGEMGAPNLEHPPERSAESSLSR